MELVVGNETGIYEMHHALLAPLTSDACEKKWMHGTGH